MITQMNYDAFNGTISSRKNRNNKIKSKSGT